MIIYNCETKSCQIRNISPNKNLAFQSIFIIFMYLHWQPFQHLFTKCDNNNYQRINVFKNMTITTICDLIFYAYELKA
jgi:hypothetical protein